MMCLSKTQDDEIMICQSKSQDKHVCTKPCYRASHQAVLKGVVRVRASLRFSQADIMLMCLSKSQDDHDDVSVEITGRSYQDDVSVKITKMMIYHDDVSVEIISIVYVEIKR
jgi:hypothetical protein